MVLRHLCFVLLFRAFVPSLAGGAVVLDEVPVRIYDSTALPAAARQHALDTARGTLAGAGIVVTWLACEGRQPGPMCDRGLRSGELVLRIVTSPRAPTAAGAAALHSRTSRLPLGDAFVDLGAQGGVLATVYLDRVTTLAAAAGGNVATLLGHAIAHELGHLLLGTNAHGTHGLMRPAWSGDEIRRGRDVDWMFTEAEVKAIRARRATGRVLGR
jgi:hypothetical protein